MKSEKLTKAEARRHLDQFLISGELHITIHAWKSMRERNFNSDDARYVIKTGEIQCVSYDDDFENWKIEIEGEDIGGHGLTVQVSLDTNEQRISLITGHTPRWKKE